MSTLAARKKPGFQVLSKGLIVMLCAQVDQQGVPDHGALYSECSAANRGQLMCGTTIICCVADL